MAPSGMSAPLSALLRYPALVAADKAPCQSPTAAPTNPRCIPHRGHSDMSPLSAKRHAAPLLLACKRVRNASACYQLFAGSMSISKFYVGFSFATC